MKSLRLALFTGNYNHIPDGVSLTLNRWVSYLLDKNIPVLVFGPTIEEPKIKHAGELVPVPSIPMPGRPEYRLTTGFPEDVQKKLRAFKPTLAHMATPDLLGFRAMRFAQLNKIQLVASYHTHFASYLKYYNLEIIESLGWKYLQWYYSQVKHLYVPSPSMAEELAEKGIANNVRIWARGVEVDLFSPQKRDLEWRRMQGFSDETPVVSFVSRLVWEKDLQTVIDTFKKVTALLPSARVMIVGDGPARKELQYMLRDAVFTGHLSGEDLARAYASSDIFFFPSTTETFGNVTLEAMSSGLPSVVANAAGSKNLVEDGVNGLVLTPKKPSEFAEGIVRLASDAGLRAQMGIASRTKALAYSWPNIHAGLLANYMEALEQPLPELKV
jgi:glycosyltransferase involved in cell wall biosynthesis